MLQLELLLGLSKKPLHIIRHYLSKIIREKSTYIHQNRLSCGINIYINFVPKIKKKKILIFQGKITIFAMN